MNDMTGQVEPHIATLVSKSNSGHPEKMPTRFHWGGRGNGYNSWDMLDVPL